MARCETVRGGRGLRLVFQQEGVPETLEPWRAQRNALEAVCELRKVCESEDGARGMLSADMSGALPVLRRVVKVLRQGSSEARQEAIAAVLAIASHGDVMMNEYLRGEPGLVRAVHALCAAPKSERDGLTAAHPTAFKTLQALGASDAIQGNLGRYPEWIIDEHLARQPPEESPLCWQGFREGAGARQRREAHEANAAILNCSVGRSVSDAVESVVGRGPSPLASYYDAAAASLGY